MNQRHIEVLSLLYKNLDFADAVLKAIAQRDNPRRKTDLYWLRREIIEGFKVAPSREEVAAVFKTFQTKGLGQLEVKRQSGAHDNFTWASGVSYVEMAQEVVKLNKGVKPNPKPAMFDGPMPTKLVVRSPLRSESPPEPARGPAILLVLDSGRELRLSFDEAHDALAQLKGIVRS